MMIDFIFKVVEAMFSISYWYELAIQSIPLIENSMSIIAMVLSVLFFIYGKTQQRGNTAETVASVASVPHEPFFKNL